MSARILDGKATAAQVVEELREEIAARPASRRAPGLAAVLVGDDPASQIYVRNKLKTCQKCGIESWLRDLPADTPQSVLEATLDELNRDERVDGILLQLPLPRGLDATAALHRMSPAKDVDGLHPENLGKLAADLDDGFVPCTPAGVVELLRRHDIDPEGKRVVVLGRSHLVGKPLALLLMRRRRPGNATVTVVHTRSRDIPALVREAEILVAAAGQPQFVQADWLRPGVVVVDVGIHRLEPAPGQRRGRLVGDVDFAAAVEVAAAITPVPGGVGPMTVAMLMANTTRSWRRKE